MTSGRMAAPQLAGRSVLVEQVQPVRGGGGLAPRGHPELAEDVRDVDAGGPVGDEQLGSDLPVATPGGDQPQHFLLACGEPERDRAAGGGLAAAQVRELDSRTPGELADLVLQRLSAQLASKR